MCDVDSFVLSVATRGCRKTKKAIPSFDVFPIRIFGLEVVLADQLELERGRSRFSRVDRVLHNSSKDYLS